MKYVKTANEDGAVHFFLKSKPEAVLCPACHSPAVRPCGQKERCYRHLPIGRKRVELVMPIPRVECDHCGAVRQITIPCAGPPLRRSPQVLRPAPDQAPPPDRHR